MKKVKNQQTMFWDLKKKAIQGTIQTLINNSNSDLTNQKDIMLEIQTF